METMISRYILEIEKDSTLFRKYGNGWYPNFDKYRMFLHKQEKNNITFSKVITKFNLLKKNDYIIETVSSKELTSVTELLGKEGLLIESGIGTIKVINELPNMINATSCYISNGIYHDTLELILKSCRGGSFIVGVCDNPTSVFYKENVTRIEELKKTLTKRNIKFSTYQHDNHRDKTLILYHRGEKVC